MNHLIIILISLFSFISIHFYGQDLPAPTIRVDSILFMDSTKVEVFCDYPGAKVMIEIGDGNSVFFRESEKNFYVGRTQTLRFKTSHENYEDSDVTYIKVFNRSGLSIDLLGDQQNLIDGKKGDFSLRESDWSIYSAEQVELQFQTNHKKLAEVELLSLISTKNGILPPKKIILYAHLRNGEKVHIRTTNTLGKFKDTEEYWSNLIRLSGKPKLKKILKKTDYFSLIVTPYFEDNKPAKLYFDELLVR